MRKRPDPLEVERARSDGVVDAADVGEQRDREAVARRARPGEPAEGLLAPCRPGPLLLDELEVGLDRHLAGVTVERDVGARRDARGAGDLHDGRDAHLRGEDRRVARAAARLGDDADDERSVERRRLGRREVLGDDDARLGEVRDARAPAPRGPQRRRASRRRAGRPPARRSSRRAPRTGRHTPRRPRRWRWRGPCRRASCLAAALTRPLSRAMRAVALRICCAVSSTRVARSSSDTATASNAALTSASAASWSSTARLVGRRTDRWRDLHHRAVCRARADADALVRDGPPAGTEARRGVRLGARL